MRDIHYPQDHRPHFNRVVTGPIDSLYDFDQVQVTGKIMLPIPQGEVGELFVQREELKPWSAWPENPDPFVTCKTIGGFGQIVCKPEYFHYKMGVIAQMWKDEKVREHIERKVRRELSDAIADRYIIQLKAEPWRYA